MDGVRVFDITLLKLADGDVEASTHEPSYHDLDQVSVLLLIRPFYEEIYHKQRANEEGAHDSHQQVDCNSQSAEYMIESNRILTRIPFCFICLRFIFLGLLCLRSWLVDLLTGDRLRILRGVDWLNELLDL